MSGSRAGRHERFFSKLIAVLSVSAALLVVALVLQSRLTARRNAQVAQQQTLNPSETVAPLIVRAATPEPDPNATQTPVATPAPPRSAWNTIFFLFIRALRPTRA